MSVLVRYGAISEVGRFANVAGMGLRRGDRVVVRTHRGIEIGTLLQESLPAETAAPPDSQDSEILRRLTDSDEQAAQSLQAQCEEEFAAWQQRIADWKLHVELIELERTLDKSKLILYVLNDRGPECTKLALQAAAAGLGIIEVQPVGPEGLLAVERGGGCGSGGCGSGGCGS